MRFGYLEKPLVDFICGLNASHVPYTARGFFEEHGVGSEVAGIDSIKISLVQLEEAWGRFVAHCEEYNQRSELDKQELMDLRYVPLKSVIVQAFVTWLLMTQGADWPLTMALEEDRRERKEKKEGGENE